MAFEERLDPRSYQASGDLSASQYLFVVEDTNGQIAVNTTAGGAVTGVLQDKPKAAGRACNVAVGGVSKVVAGGTIALGDPIASNNAGKAIKATTTGHKIIGTARTAGASGEIVSVELLANPGTA